METRSNPFANLAALILGTLFLLGVGYGVLVAVQRGIVQLPPAQMTVNGQRPQAPAPPAIQTRPFIQQPASAPEAQQPAQVAPAAQPAQAAPAPTEWQAPGVAAPAGEPMTEEYKATLQEQQRTNANGEVCAPRSGCTKPGSAGPQPWPNGRP